MKFLRMVLLSCLLGTAVGCVTIAEFRKLEREVIDMGRGGGTPSPGGERLADLAARLEALEGRLDKLDGRLEVAEHRTGEALQEARAAREESAAATPAVPAADEQAVPDAAGGAQGAGSDEVRAYRAAYSAWRANDHETCVDRFRQFLQTYASSAYADDAAYWLADCHFKQGDFKKAVLRFDDVVVLYPTGNKAADALYRQGEALLRLGPGFGKAAGKAFERVLQEYPESARAPEAKRQLKLLGTG